MADARTEMQVPPELLAAVERGLAPVRPFASPARRVLALLPLGLALLVAIPMVWGLRLWNGRGEQMITVLFPSVYYDEADDFRRLPEPDWSKTRLWEEMRKRFA